MNAVGWLGGGGSAPLVIGIVAQSVNLTFAIAATSAIYVAAGLLLTIGLLFFVDRDAARVEGFITGRAKPSPEPANRGIR
jgi:hypothetical protein